MDECKQMLWHSFNSFNCSKKVVINGYCKIHDPEYIKKKEEKRLVKYRTFNCKKEKCHWNFKTRDYYKYCPFCGTKK